METETAILDTQKRYGSRALLLSIGVAIIFILLGHKEICRGLVLGGLFSTLNFVLMGLFLRARLDGNRRSGAAKAFASLLARYVVLAIPVVIAIKVDRYSLPATVVGIFMVQLVILIEHGSQLIMASFKH